MGLLTGAKIFAVLAILTILGSGFTYVMSLRSDLAISESNNVTLQNSVSDLKVSILKQEKKAKEDRKNILEIQQINMSISTTNNEMQKEMQKLHRRFDIKANGQSRDFGKIARAKPGLINNIINEATVRSNRCFAIVAGAKIEEGEKNVECQDIINRLSQ